MTYLIFDVAIAALLLLAVFRGYRRGFILTLCGFLAIFVALIGATVVSNMLAEPVSQAIRPIIESSIQEYVAQVTPAPGPAEPEPEEETSPDLSQLLKLLEQSKIYRGFADAFQKAVDDGMVAATSNAVRTVAAYVAKQVAQMALFLIAFVLILILWFFVSHALDLAFRLPVLSTLNHWTGAVLGLFKGSLLLFIACWVLKGSLLPQDAIQNSYLLNFFCTVSPLTLLF